MSIRQAYDHWAGQYDTSPNQTRALEGQALRTTLRHLPVDWCLEIGCGTGKNTEWLLTRAQQVTAVDFSEKMLAQARATMASDRVRFQPADINQPWAFAAAGAYSLISFSLVLEHIEHLGPIFREAAAALAPGGHVYIGELHPFKQYAGSKARFDTAEGTQVLECFTHHVSDFVQAAKPYGLGLADVNEYFDNDDRTTLPRILTLVLRKA